jgi:hypothetical protein
MNCDGRSRNLAMVSGRGPAGPGGRPTRVGLLAVEGAVVSVAAAISRR